MALSKPPVKRKSAARPRWRNGLLLGTAIAVLGVYGGVCVYYHGHFFPHTTIGGISCGNQTAAALESENVQAANAYTLTVTDRKGNTYPLSGTDFGYAYQATGEEKKLLQSQNVFTWPVAIFRSHTHELDQSFTYDTDALETLIDGLAIFDADYIQAPEDAHLEITDDDYKVVPETPGNTPIREEILSEITQAIADQKTTLPLTDACYEAPSVTADDASITDLVAQIDKYTASTVHYEIDGVDENLDKAKILSLLDISDDGTVSVNDTKLTAYVQYLASTYNTYGDVRKFKTSKGDTVKIGGGDYGWVINKAKEKEELLKDLKSGKATEREPVYEQTAIQSGLDDIGDTYVEIDYTNQHLWYYKEGKLLLETDIVSGNISRGNGSPDGVFKIVYKQRNATLVGENYASDVNYFMPFAYNVGIHDASWRSTFGKEIYKTSGSHGCINVPPKKAAKLYKLLETGTPVVAFYREPVTLTAENTRISNAYSYKADAE